MYQWLKWGGIICLIIGILSLPFAAIMYIYNQPRTSGIQFLAGLHGKVIISRDQWGIPHILATKTDTDAFFALGYVHAQDRFWQMEMQRHIVQGRLSELFGKTTLDKDKYLRTWGFYHAAESAWPNFSLQAKTIVQAYTDGVNAYIRQHRFPLPIILLQDNPRPWTVIDSIAWQKMLAWDLQTHWRRQLRNYQIAQQFGVKNIPIFYPAYPTSAPIILSNADLAQSHLLMAKSSFQNHIKNNISLLNLSALQKEDEQLRKFLQMQSFPSKGSNNWVVNGQWTTTGKPMLANDPHLELQSPALWYLAEIKGPHLHVIGATIPGMPGVVIGHNDHIAWGVTNVNPDTQDLYVLAAKTPTFITHETIQVKLGKTIDFPVLLSPKGPIISEITQGKMHYPIAIQWTALQPNDTTVQSMLEINYAQNWQDFLHALKDFVVPAQNFVYADIRGNIGYYLAGKIPLRTKKTFFPQPDNTSSSAQGFIPFEKLPHVFNPPEGIIVTANNKAVSEQYPYTLTAQWLEPPYRAQRILQLIHQLHPLTINKNKMIQLDTTSLLWQQLAPLLLTTSPLDENSRIALSYLKNWSGECDLSSISCTIFAYWYKTISSTLSPKISSAPLWPDPLFLQQQLQMQSDNQKQPHKNSEDLLGKTLQAAMQQLTKKLGTQPNKWRWQFLHHATFVEMGIGNVAGIGNFWNRQIATPGALYTVNVGPFDPITFHQREGASYRQIIDLSNFDHSVFIQTLGQSNDPLNSHYDDQMPLWQKGKYLAMSNNYYDWGKTQTLTLIPH